VFASRFFLHLVVSVFGLCLFKFCELTVLWVRGLQVCVEENQACATD